jgi:hypothetical protein
MTYLNQHQRAASSVVFSDFCNLNPTVYLYVFSCISLFWYTIIHLAGHRVAATAFRFFAITVWVWCIRNFAWPEFQTCIMKSFMYICYDSHTLSLYIMANSLRKNVRMAKRTLKKKNNCLDWDLNPRPLTS